MILIIVLSLELLPGTDQDLETCSAIFICYLKLKLIIYKQRVPSSVPLLLTEEAPLLVFLSLLRSLLRTGDDDNTADNGPSKDNNQLDDDNK